MQEVKRRGRWVSDSSLKRYSKETRLIEVMQRVPLPTVEKATRLQERPGPALVAAMPANVASYKR